MSIISINIERARIFQIAAHGACGQVRKYSGIPYSEHPTQVAELIASYSGFNEDMICASYLHDVVEDTKITLEMIEYYFGARVAELVDGLTNKHQHDPVNRAMRKALELERLKKESPEVKTIKLADTICNLNDIIVQDANFAKTFCAEKRQLVNLALREGDSRLWRIANSILDKYYLDLDIKAGIVTQLD